MHTLQPEKIDVIFFSDDSFLSDTIFNLLNLSRDPRVAAVYLVSSDANVIEECKGIEKVVPASVPGNDWATVATQLLDRMESTYFTVQHTGILNLAHRFNQSLKAMREYGIDLFICRGDYHPQAGGGLAEPGAENAIFRKTAFIDSGIKSGETPHHATALRWTAEGRVVCNISRLDFLHQSTKGTWFSVAKDVVHPHFTDVKCDVVLPFYNHIGFLNKSINSILNQINANVTVHLVDDCSSVDTTEILKFWSCQPNVRVYRNQKNIGQFLSFNNIAANFAESDYIAVQDADDASRPERLWYAVNCLHLSKADFFASSLKTFGNDREYGPGFDKQSGRLDRTSRLERMVPDIRESYNPVEERTYFAENPTVVMRKSSFLSLGGFGDFGDLLQNKAALDTEFYRRAHLAGSRFFISKKVTLDLRCHDSSETQNPTSGWGSLARKAAEEAAETRIKVYQGGSFDPRIYGAIGSTDAITKPLVC